MPCHLGIKVAKFAKCTVQGTVHTTPILDLVEMGFACIRPDTFNRRRYTVAAQSALHTVPILFPRETKLWRCSGAVHKRCTNSAYEECPSFPKKAMHTILCAMDENQYKLIQNTRIAKEAWDILEVAHEGTKVVKDSKLQVLQT
ncbi:hypothetical protein QYF36_015340 [Acer negundo]|nr:hypothetical protein QYF36_015340 [Acer negundo]